MFFSQILVIVPSFFFIFSLTRRLVVIGWYMMLHPIKFRLAGTIPNLESKELLKWGRKMQMTWTVHPLKGNSRARLLPQGGEVTWPRQGDAGVTRPRVRVATPWQALRVACPSHTILGGLTRAWWQRRRLHSPLFLCELLANWRRWKWGRNNTNFLTVKWGSKIFINRGKLFFLKSAKPNQRLLVLGFERL